MTSDYELVEVKKANCIEDGFELYVNKITQEEKKVIIPKREHNWKEYIIKQPTCTEKGIKYYLCKNEENNKYEACYVYEDEVIIPELGHLCKAENIVRTEKALRRGAIIKCLRDGCNYQYIYNFQTKEDGIETGQGPSPAPQDVDSLINSVLHFGADLSRAKIEFFEEDGNLLLILTEEMIQEMKRS